MLFNSWPFVWLVLVTVALYYQKILRSSQVIILLLASCVFYAYGQPLLLLLLLVSASINAIASYQVTYGAPQRRQTWAIAGLTLNLLVLGFFKYAGLLTQPFFGATTSTNDLGYWLVNLPLPVGISFYTFQGISLVVDAFTARRTTDQQNLPYKLTIPTNFWTHYWQSLFFISFFPQLVAGPIVKAHEFLPQIRPKHWADINWEVVTRYLVLGYFLKMVIADNLQNLTTWISYPQFLNLSSLNLIALLIGYSAQIFADFAGYSLIAMGIGALFGYRLPQNFNFPYLSRSVTEFWRRWHLSLSSWLREYLYFPLGGNRKSTGRTVFNLLLVMFLGGLWHGAAWSYGIWGVWHGLGLVIERPFRHSAWFKTKQVVFVVVQILVTFSFVTLGWLLFKLPHFPDVLAFLQTLATNWRLSPDKLQLAMLAFYIWPVVIYHLHALRPHWQLKGMGPTLAPLAYGVMVFAITLNSGPKSAFIYFQF